MTKASPARAEKKAAQTKAKKDPREAAKAAVAKKEAEAEAKKPAPTLTGQQALQALGFLDRVPTQGRGERQGLAALEAKLVAIADAAGLIQHPPQPMDPPGT